LLSSDDFLQFVVVPPETSLLYMGSHNLMLVAVSIGIAVLAAYAAFDVAEQLSTTPAGRRRTGWLLMGGMVMGVGVWAMHFIGMLAFSIPCGVQYDPLTTFISMLPGVAASTLALAIISRPTLSVKRLAWAGVLFGAGIGTMHYTGMAALRMDALLRYDLNLFLVSIAVAVVLAWIALWVKFGLGKKQLSRTVVKTISAVVMGVAVSGMHYTAMAAAYFIRDGDRSIPVDGMHPQILAIAVLIFSTLLVAITMFAAFARRLSDAAERYRLVADYAYAWEIWVDEHGDFKYISPASTLMTGYSPAEFQNDAGLMGRIVHPDDRERVLRHLGSCDKDCHGIDDHMEFRLIHKDGSFRWIEHNCQPVFGKDGRYLGRRGSNRDITLRKQTEEMLQNLSLAVEQNPCSIVVTDMAANIQYVNRHFTEETGYTLAEVIGQNPSVLQSGLTDRCVFEQLWASLKRGAQWQGEFVNRRKDGSIYIERAFIAPVINANGQANSYVAIKLNITDQRQAEDRLRLAASVFANAREGIIISDADNRIIDVNQTFCEITGYSRDDVLGQSPRLLKSGGQNADFYAEMWKTLDQDGYWRGEVWNRKKNGEVYAEQLTISTVKDLRGRVTHYVGIFTDITPHKENEKRLERMAHYDALTQLPNRILLVDRMRQAMAQADRGKHMLAICYLDLDGFKPVNDQHGHDAGDRLLMEISRRLQDVLRTTDTVARLGGDEFALVIGGIKDLGECERTLNRVLHSIAMPFQIPDGSQVAVSGSLGLTLYPDDNADSDALLRHADQAMYQAKQQGRNRYHVFDSERDRQVHARSSALQRLAQALEDDEFVLYYQPKVDMRYGQVIGAEALIRWQHPERGLLPPGEFLPVIEGSELSIDLGQWVLDQALQQLQAWAHQGIDLGLSINISAEHLQQQNFMQHLKQSLAKYPDVLPNRLELEVLETSALADLAHVSSIIVECQMMGMAFALDDFGTGYASLSYLRRLPAKILKIDQVFVRDMLDDKEDMAIVEGVIALAKTFKRTVIAEGIESAEQGILLMHLGCYLGQGYGIARPMPIEKFATWLAQYQPSQAWLQAASIQYDKADLPLMMAMAAFGDWLEKLHRYVGLQASDATAPPPMNPSQSRFGLWYHSAGKLLYGETDEYQTLGTIHEEIHALAEQLVSAHRNDDSAEVARIMNAMQEHENTMFDAVTGLIVSRLF
jgi:diguanylate cyclase (GGDEF)-like protein/PAS domain S-box-containing protein